MDSKKNEDPGPSEKSNLIILTPQELAKLGLFQQIQTAAQPAPVARKATDTSKLTLQKLKNKIQTDNKHQKVSNKLGAHKNTTTSADLGSAPEVANFKLKLSSTGDNTDTKMKAKGGKDKSVKKEKFVANKTISLNTHLNKSKLHNFKKSSDDTTRRALNSKEVISKVAKVPNNSDPTSLSIVHVSPGAEISNSISNTQNKKEDKLVNNATKGITKEKSQEYPSDKLQKSFSEDNINISLHSGFSEGLEKNEKFEALNEGKPIPKKYGKKRRKSSEESGQDPGKLETNTDNLIKENEDQLQEKAKRNTVPKAKKQEDRVGDESVKVNSNKDIVVNNYVTDIVVDNVVDMKMQGANNNLPGNCTTKSQAKEKKAEEEKQVNTSEKFDECEAKFETKSCSSKAHSNRTTEKVSHKIVLKTDFNLKRKNKEAATAQQSNVRHVSSDEVERKMEDPQQKSDVVIKSAAAQTSNVSLHVSSDEVERNTEDTQQKSNVTITVESSKTAMDSPPVAEEDQKNVSVTKSVQHLKKRGRPRKIIESNEANQDTEKLPPLELNEDEAVTSTPLPKKRGRKRKSELPAPTVEDTSKEFTLGESVNGRKRKKINYFELENSAVDEDTSIRRRSRKFVLDPQYKELNPSKKKKVNIVVEENSSACTVEESVGKDTKDSIQEESNLTNSCTFSQSNNNQSETDLKVNASDGDVEESNPKTKKQYRRHGETSVMLKSIFSAAVKNNSISELAVDENHVKEAESSNVVTKKRKASRGRPKKSGNVVDEDNAVTCVTCNLRVPNEEWQSHNRTQHYNLAWRKGHQKLNLKDKSFVEKTLTLILNQDEKLTCQQCEKSYKNVNDFLTHTEECKILQANSLVICAVCNLEIEKSKWAFHKQKKHNNLAWKTGERPLDLNDQGLVLNILNALYKAKKPLYCEKCGESKKSVVGFLSHKSQCGLELEDVRVKCDFCSKKVLPVSMQSHIKLVHEKKESIEVESECFDAESNGVGSKRKAAMKAMTLIDNFSKDKIVQEHAKYYKQQISFVEEAFVKVVLQKELAEKQIVKCKFMICEFESDQVATLAEHMDVCQNKPDQYYACRRCLLICDTEDAMKVHMKTAYNIDIIDDKYEVEEIDEDEADEMMDLNYKELKKMMVIQKKKSEKDINYKIKPAFILNLIKQPRKLFSRAYNFTYEFCEKYFTSNLLYQRLRYSPVDWKLLDEDLAECYLPKFAESCEVARREVTNFVNVLGSTYTFKKFDLFETECHDGTITIYCGGPIYALAWMPTPYTSLNSKQVLAVAAASDFDTKFLANVNYNNPSVIQFWDFGPLRNKQNMTAPTLMFCLAVEFGPVWHIEWCPSGCYDTEEINDSAKDMSRLGLLAVAGSDSVVYVYAVPGLKEEQLGLIYKVKPLLKLHLVMKKEHLDKEQFYATKISWSMAQGHKYLAIGYTDGMVGLFDLDTNSSLLRSKDADGTDILLPYKAFQAHTHFISALSLIHLNGGNRWLLTGSFDRDTYVWDLTNNYKSCTRKCIVSDSVWLPNWMAFVSTYEEMFSTTVHTNLKSYRNFLYDHVYLTSSPSTIKSVSSSSWLNGIIQCSSAGEITGVFPHQLLYSVDSDKSLKTCTYLFGYTKLIDKHKNPDERVAEEVEKQKALKVTGRLKDHSSTSESILNSVNCHYNKYEPITYKEAKEKYGIVFCDMKMDGYNDLQKQREKSAKYTKKLEPSKPNLYPMQSINKIAYNPNLQASLYCATGYQAGFVRLIYMKFLENDRQIV